MNQESVESPPVKDYYQHRRENISRFIQKGGNHVLDVGCAAGNFRAFLKHNGYADEVVGLELVQQAADQAREKLDSVFCADLNQTSVGDVLATYPGEPFHYIVCADVLEHLVDPWTALKELTQRLAPGGRVIASIPNVRHWSVSLPLLGRGRWEYEDEGIMDRTHLRFFTRPSMRALFDQAGLEVLEMHPLIGGKWKLLDRCSLHLLRDLIAVQWVLVGKRKGS